MSCPTLVQNSPVRQSLCNYCATKNATVFQPICGTVTNATKHIVLPSGITQLPYPVRLEDHPLTRIFKYPSRKYMGQEIDEELPK